MEINEKLLRQIIEDVLRDMKGSDKPVSFNAPAASTAPQTAAPAGDGFLTEVGEARRHSAGRSHYRRRPGIWHGANRQYRRLTA